VKKTSQQMLKKIIILSFFLFNCVSAQEISTCFTPGGNCTDQIVKRINEAKTSLYVQAYSFTSQPIIQAIVKAHERGLIVKVILDKENEGRRNFGAQTLIKNKIDVLIDDKPAIAHNKVMVVDEKDVITGSFNFTKSAQDRNAENVLFINNDPIIAKKYLENFNNRALVSRKIKEQN
jgi:phosphatidylserine/phosphatidylglycerophosphate/cardiolipin synthase-like enzyme